jgi:ribosomal protein S18 acetylase RimI-like enzyme
MHRVDVKEENYHLVQELIETDRYSYYWHDVDWEFARDRTKISLAMEGDRCVASLLSWSGNVLQLRGSPAGAHFLLDGMDLSGMEIGTTLELASAINGWPAIERFRVDMLALPRGEERLKFKAKVVDLEDRDAARVGQILRACDVGWERFSEDAVRSSMRENIWVGVKDGEELAAVGMTSQVGRMHNIGIIATDARFRGRGYATSMVSELVKRIHQKVPVALIHVKTGNTPAEKAYCGVGFKRVSSSVVHRLSP